MPNVDGNGYGYFQLDSLSTSFLLNFLTHPKINSENDDIAKLSALIILNENLWANNLNPQNLIETLFSFLSHETNTLLFARALGYLSTAYIPFFYDKGVDVEIERSLWKIVTENSNPQHRTLAFKTYTEIFGSDESVKKIYDIWLAPEKFKYVSLGERDLIKLSYELSLRLPEKYKEIKFKQLSRISNPDRIREYLYVSPALSPEKSVRDSVFNSLLIEKNRSVEPWTAKSLSYLNHYLRDSLSNEYILPGLLILKEIQTTGDIFFPSNWSKALLNGHRSRQSFNILEEFFKNNQGYSEMLTNKIRQQSYHLYVINN